MYPPVYDLALADADVKTVLGNPPRLYLFGEAPQNVKRPYAVWQQLGGSPENYLNQRPDIDTYSVQVDVYATTGQAARGVAAALRDCWEGAAHVTGWNGEFRESDTRDYRYSFTVDFWVNR